MIKSFRHKGLRRFFETGSQSGIRPDHAARLRRQLAVLDNVVDIVDVPPVWRPHVLKGNASSRIVADTWSIWVSGNWRLTFAFDGNDVVELDYLDYH